MSRRTALVRRISSGDLVETSLDLATNHGQKVALLPSRESHTADLDYFDRQVAQLAAAERLYETDTFEPKVWSTIRQALEAAAPTGYSNSTEPAPAEHRHGRG